MADLSQRRMTVFFHSRKALTMLFGRIKNKHNLKKWLIILAILLVLSVIFGQVIDNIDLDKHRGAWWAWPVLIIFGIPSLSFAGALIFFLVAILRGNFRNNDAT